MVSTQQLPARMRTLGMATFFSLLITASSTPAFSQTPILDLIKNKEITAAITCEPNLATDNDWYFTVYGLSCCGSPGRRPCISWSPCAAGGRIYQDPFDGQNYCGQPAIPPESTDLLPPKRPATGADFTFYVTSDMHFFRNNYDTDMQAFHAANINHFATSGELWPDGAGIPPVPISPPTAIVVPGDLGMCGGPEMLGAYRLVWEKESAPDSIHYPVYFGLGNHDLISRDEAGCTDTAKAKRLWYYLDARTAHFHSDRSVTGCLLKDGGCPDYGPEAGSHNYSWDWHGVHMVMLNTWAGESNRAYLPAQRSNGLAWLANDLAAAVGTTNAPVILFQHYTLGDIGTWTWQTTDYTQFWNVIKNYNVIGLFSGHTHSLGTVAGTVSATSEKFASMSQGWNMPFLDNFIDGNGGACHSELCSGSHNGTANFLVARVTDHYLDVTAITESENTITTVGDTGMNFPKSARACRKRINSPYISSTDQLVHDSAGYHYQNGSAVPIYGPIAITYTGLTQPDFVDRCASGQGYKMLIGDGEVLHPGEGLTLDLGDDQPNVSGIKLYVLHDSLESTIYSSTSPGSGSLVTNLSVGAAPVNVYVQTHLRQYKHFTYTSDVSWLSVSEDDTDHRFPTILTLSLSTPIQGTGHITITADDTSIPPLTLNVTAQVSQITVASLPGGRVGQVISVDNVAYVAPHSFLWPVGGTHTLNAGQPSATPGARQTFVSWAGGQPVSFTYTVPPAAATLTATFAMSYLLSWDIRGLGTLVASPSSADGYYASNSQVSVTAVPATGYSLRSFAGALSGTTNPQTVTVYKPTVVTATFAIKP
ncbi:MAG TPA: metallophosphoesterase [Thermoanaerobaculia bacterium]|jgi:hypothetical protein|nr:metallophosphoesterase [Thermoanaerobaculia bacterium]